MSSDVLGVRYFSLSDKSTLNQVGSPFDIYDIHTTLLPIGPLICGFVDKSDRVLSQYLPAHSCWYVCLEKVSNNPTSTKYVPSATIENNGIKKKKKKKKFLS